jgi:thiamine phosphate synthase YjbQ (UPF0047 family)
MPTSSLVQLATLLVQQTKAEIYDYAIGIAESIGLPVSTWQAGDPTRSLFHIESELLATLEEVVVNFVKSGFLDYATGDWLKVVADQVFGVTVPSATYATTDVTLTNTGGGLYTIEAGDLTLKNSTTGKTYRNTTGGTLASGPGTTLTITVTADEAGSESSAGAGEIDELVTGLLGVTCTNPTAAVGVDEQDESVTKQQCRDKLDSFSPNGPKGAYSYVARNSELTGTSNITRVRVYSDSDTGDVTVYLAGASGAIAAADRDLVEEAILEWATPLCITPTVSSATNVTVNVTYELWIYKSCNKTAAEVADDIETALEAMFAERPIGGDIIPPSTTGALYHSMIESTIRGVFPQAFRCTLSSPSGDTAITNGQVAALGTVSGTVHIVVDP